MALSHSFHVADGQILLRRGKGYLLMGSQGDTAISAAKGAKPATDAAANPNDSRPPVIDKIADIRHAAYSSDASVSKPEQTEPRAAADLSGILPTLKITEATSRPGDKTPSFGQQTLSPDAESLLKLAENKIQLPGYPHAKQEFEQFNKDIRTFEEQSKKNGLSAKEISETYKGIERLLSSVSSAGVAGTGATENGIGRDRQRTRVAEQLMNMVAHPEDRNQGDHDTCAMATVEGLLLTGPLAEPSKVTKMVADVALTGQTNVGGIVSKVDRESLRSFGEAAENRNVGEDKQRLAESVFRLTAANVYFGIQRAAGNSEGQLRYVNRGDDDHIQYNPDPVCGLEHSDELKKYNTKKGLDTSAGPASTPTAQSKILHQITGKDYKDRIITNGVENPDEDSAWVTKYNNKQEFGQVLKKLQADGRYPVLLDLWDADKAIKSDTNGFDNLGKTHGRDEILKAAGRTYEYYKDHHSLMISNRIESYGTAFDIKNTWGADSNKSVSENELYRSTFAVSANQVIDDLKTWKDKQTDPAKAQKSDQYFAGVMIAAAYLIDVKLHIPEDAEHSADQVLAGHRLKQIMDNFSPVQKRLLAGVLKGKTDLDEDVRKQWESIIR